MTPAWTTSYQTILGPSVLLSISANDGKRPLRSTRGSPSVGLTSRETSHCASRVPTQFG